MIRREVELECERCGRVVGNSKGDHDGWLMWFEDDDVVKSFGVYCRYPCARRVVLGYPGNWRQLDGHLFWFCWDDALPCYQRLVRDYKWAPDMLQKCTDFFFKAHLIPAVSVKTAHIDRDY